MESTLTRALEVRLDDVSDGERSIVAVINTAAVDRYKTVILPRGGKLDDYRRNPIVPWCHGMDEARGAMPVARCLWVKYDKGSDRTIAKSVFLQDEFAEGVFRAYQAGALNAFSVRFLPSDDCSPPTPAEVRARPELADCRFLYRRWTLLEYSAVDVPGNAECLKTAVARGLWLPAAIRPLAAPQADGAQAVRTEPVAPELPPLFGRTPAQVLAAMRRRIAAGMGAATHQGIRDAADLARGKI